MHCRNGIGAVSSQCPFQLSLLGPAPDSMALRERPCLFLRRSSKNGGHKMGEWLASAWAWLTPLLAAGVVVPFVARAIHKFWIRPIIQIGLDDKADCHQRTPLVSKQDGKVVAQVMYLRLRIRVNADNARPHSIPVQFVFDPTCSNLNFNSLRYALSGMALAVVVASPQERQRAQVAEEWWRQLAIFRLIIAAARAGAGSAPVSRDTRDR